MSTAASSTVDALAPYTLTFDADHLREHSFLLGTRGGFVLYLPAATNVRDRTLHPTKWFGASGFGRSFFEGLLVRNRVARAGPLHTDLEFYGLVGAVSGPQEIGVLPWSHSAAGVMGVSTGLRSRGERRCLDRADAPADGDPGGRGGTVGARGQQGYAAYRSTHASSAGISNGLSIAS